jgi:hypothetical protein
MTIRELIDELEDLREDLGDDTEVRIAQQPSWPFAYSIGEIAATDSVDVGDKDEDGIAATEADAAPAVIYIGEGRQLGYLDSAGADALGWGRR